MSLPKLNIGEKVGDIEITAENQKIFQAIQIKSIEAKAHTGNSNDKYEVGEIFETQLQNYEKAAEFYLMAAKEGHNGAIIKLEEFYNQGILI